MSHLQALCVSVAVAVIGLLVSLVPGWAVHQQELIQTTTAVISGVFMLVTPLHNMVKVGRELMVSLPTLRSLEANAAAVVEHEVHNANIDQLVADVVKGKVNAGEIEKLVQAAIVRLAGQAPFSNPVPAVAPPVPAEVPPAPATPPAA